MLLDSLVLSPLQRSWLQEIHIAPPFIPPEEKRAVVSMPASTPTVAPPIAPPVVDLASMSLLQLQAHVEQCQSCDLHEQRMQTVWGAGQTQQPEWFVISTAPSSHEELAGLPMQAKSGELFAAQMQSIGLDLAQQLFLTQLLKCHTTSKTFSAEYLQACKGVLFKQIALIQPKRLLLLGSKAAAMFLGEAHSFEALRGQLQRWQSPAGRELPVVVSYHPSSLLLRPQLKGQAWQDLLLMQHAMQ